MLRIDSFSLRPCKRVAPTFTPSRLNVEIALEEVSVETALPLNAWPCGVAGCAYCSKGGPKCPSRD